MLLPIARACGLTNIPELLSGVSRFDSVFRGLILKTCENVDCFLNGSFGLRIDARLELLFFWKFSLESSILSS